MRLIDFETILAQSLQLCGLDRTNLSLETFEQFRDFANHRLRFGFEYDMWPQLIRTTKMAVVHQNDKHFINLPPDGTVVTDEGTLKVDVGTVFNVSINDPRATGKLNEVAFVHDEYEVQVASGIFRDQERIIINDPEAEFAYVTYRIDCPELVGNLWSAGTYYKDQQVYWAYANNKYFAPTTGPNYAGKKGNFWKCIPVAGTTESPNINNNSIPASSDKWEKVRIPQFLGNFIIKGVHADWLRSEMQVEYAQAIEREAMAVLDFEVQKAIVQQGFQPRLRFNQTY